MRGFNTGLFKHERFTTEQTDIVGAVHTIVNSGAALAAFYFS